MGGGQNEESSLFPRSRPKFMKSNLNDTLNQLSDRWWDLFIVKLRTEYEGPFYHVTSSENQKGPISSKDQHREEFKKILGRTEERYGQVLHASVLSSSSSNRDSSGQS